MKNFFEEEFDIRKYINKRILEISNLDERILYREITESLIAELFEKQRCEIKDLIQRVLNEIDRSYINYDIDRKSVV